MIRTRWLLLAVFCSMALYEVRYIGFAIVCGMAIMLPRWRYRLAVIVPAVAIYVIGLFVTGTMRMNFLPFGRQDLNLLNVPLGVAGVATGLVPLFLLAGIVVMAWNQDRPVRILAAGVAAYTLALLGTVIAQRYDPLLDIRLFVPIAAPLFVLGIGLTLRYAPRMALFLMAGLAAVSLTFAYKNWPGLKSMESKVIASPRYAKSPLIEVIKKQPKDMPIYTNSAFMVYYHTGKFTKLIPGTARSVEINPNLISTMEEVKRTGGLLCWFGKRDEYMPPDSFKELVYNNMVYENPKTGDVAMMVRGTDSAWKAREK